MLAYLTHNLTLYEVLDRAHSYGRLEIVAKFQIDINDRIDQMNEILGTVQEIRNE